MSTPHGYILDTNVFIEAARRYYALDIAPGFWNALIKHAGYGRIISIDMVKDEIDKGNDALKIWINSHFQRWFESTVQEDVTKSYSVVIAWAQSQTQYSPAAKADFAGCPDGWIIAYALAKKLVVVTHEVFDPNTKKKIKIPNVCSGVGVTYTDTFQMLRALGIKWN